MGIIYGRIRESIKVGIWLFKFYNNYLNYLNYHTYHIYLGEYMDDKKHGFGKYKWQDDRKYIGYWDMGKQNGYGKYIMKNGSTQYGIWSKGKRIMWFNDTDIKNLDADEKFQKVYNEEW